MFKKLPLTKNKKLVFIPNFLIHFNNPYNLNLLKFFKLNYYLEKLYLFFHN